MTMKQKEQITMENMGAFSLDDVILMWSKKRYALFLQHKADKRSHEWIARKYNITRQAVGQFLKRMRSLE